MGLASDLSKLNMGVVQYLLIASCVYAIATASILFKDCGSTGKITSVGVIPCSTQPACQAKKSTDITLDVKFTSVAHGIIKGVPLPFAHDTNACNYASCPIKG